MHDAMVLLIGAHEAGSKPTVVVGDAYLDEDGDVVMQDAPLEDLLVDVAPRDEDGDVVMEDAW
ncbi:hypothetical protein VPNG_03399 [Cytospora leucostoma]|uniref:Uncharacterized protein n=1 Tax=Cytospora leucostoma TaxID=1230097 RepID=A0A423XFU3_9PEZI|nr:hypothetical protein VPNG_03399 [Cytospora leucostoma]